MSGCFPVTRHCLCKGCGSYFRRTDGDCITELPMAGLRCPYCGGTELSVVEESPWLESLSSVRNGIRRLLRIF